MGCGWGGAPLVILDPLLGQETGALDLKPAMILILGTKQGAMVLGTSSTQKQTRRVGKKVLKRASPRVMRSPRTPFLFFQRSFYFFFLLSYYPCYWQTHHNAMRLRVQVVRNLPFLHWIAAFRNLQKQRDTHPSPALHTLTDWKAN